MVALDTMTYAECVEVFGERCGICGRTPQEDGVTLHRDHEHRGNSMKIRGLLCIFCNRVLTTKIDNAPWLLAAAAYLVRAAER
jgi:hypothetical protein